MKGLSNFTNQNITRKKVLFKKKLFLAKRFPQPHFLLFLLFSYYFKLALKQFSS